MAARPDRPGARRLRPRSAGQLSSTPRRRQRRATAGAAFHHGVRAFDPHPNGRRLTSACLDVRRCASETTSSRFPVIDRPRRRPSSPRRIHQTCAPVSLSLSPPCREVTSSSSASGTTKASASSCNGCSSTAVHRPRHRTADPVHLGPRSSTCSAADPARPHRPDATKPASSTCGPSCPTSYAPQPFITHEADRGLHRRHPDLTRHPASPKTISSLLSTCASPTGTLLSPTHLSTWMTSTTHAAPST